MLRRQAEGKFQNGVRDAGGQGVDWTDWNGNAIPCRGMPSERKRAESDHCEADSGQ
jgi:hypothetical protein